MFRRILVAGWAVIIGGMLLLLVFPKLAMLIPHPEFIRYFLLIFVPFSSIYGLVWVYRRGTRPRDRRPRTSPGPEPPGES